LDKPRVASILKRAGFFIERQWIDGQANFALAIPSPK
jgi:hypothetical protein